MAEESIFSGLNNLAFNSILDSRYSECFGFTPEEVKEIAIVYNKEILQKLTDIIPQGTALSIQEALYSNDAQRLQKEIHKLLLQSASCCDTVGENFYHGFVLGFCAMMDNRCYISSNGELGEGWYALQLLPKSENMPGILIELKEARNFFGDKLKQLSETVLTQIEDRKYDTDMTAKGGFYITYKNKDFNFAEILNDMFRRRLKNGREYNT